MIPVAKVSAVLAGPDIGVADPPAVRYVEPLDNDQDLGPAAGYALAAMAALGDLPARLELFVSCGPVGSQLHAFDRAVDARTGQLHGEGFRRRSRRIHPFTLLRSLQNQVAFAVSRTHGLQGPCTELVDGDLSFAYALPVIEKALQERPVLCLLASAADRAEHRSRWQARSGAVGLEGAIAVLFGPGGGAGFLHSTLGDVEPAAAGPAHTSLDPTLSPAVFAPGLEPLLPMLDARAGGHASAVWRWCDERRRVEVHWRAS